MKVIVITGGIGSGKSLACEYLHSQYGWPVYEADVRVKELYVSHPTLLADIESALDADLRTNDGSFNPQSLASIIFQDSEALSRVEALVFPMLQIDFETWKTEHDDNRFGILESATILEKPQLKDLGDYLLLIDAPVDIRLNRAISRDGVSEVKVKQRMDKQFIMNAISSGSIPAPADHVILNDGSTDKLYKKLDEFVKNTL